MQEKLDIYNYERQLKRYIEKVKESNDISERDKKLILDYKDHLFLRGLSKPRIIKYLEILSIIARKVDKNFEDLNKKDVEAFVSYIQQKKYSPWTRQVYKVMIKRFLTWINDDVIPETVSWIKINISKSEKKLPGEGDMISEEEINKALKSCHNARDRCLVSVLYESGCRIGEIASLKIGNVKFDKYGVTLNVFGKTGARRIRLVKSTAYIRMYIETHPDKDNMSAHLWVNIGTRNHNKPMVYPAFRKRLQDIFEKAGIKKRCNPHMFRHSRATHMANHLTEFQMNQYFGWQQGSDMPSTYVHLSGRDVEGAILTMNGIVPKEEDEDQYKPIKCPRCELINPYDTQYCIKCSQILNEKVAIEHDKFETRQKMINLVMGEMIKDTNTQQQFLRKLTELGLSSKALDLESKGV